MKRTIAVLVRTTSAFDSFCNELLDHLMKKKESLFSATRDCRSLTVGDTTYICVSAIRNIHGVRWTGWEEGYDFHLHPDANGMRELLWMKQQGRQ